VRVEHVIEIAAPIERVWALTVDVERWPEVSPRTMQSVRWLDGGEVRIGRRARVKQPMQRATTWTVADLHEPHRFAWTARVLGTQMTASHELSESGGRVTNMLVVEASGPFARLLARPIAVAIARENVGFKRVAESTSSTSTT
jgi:uncharacterized membrane protein